MIISNIKKLYSLRNKKAKDSLGRPITLFVLFSLILSVFVYTGGKMNEVVSDANGGKMPVYDKNYYDGMYRDDPKHQNADENTRLPWLADWIRLDLNSETKIFIGKFVNAPRIDSGGTPISTWFLSPGDIIMSISCDLLQIITVLFLFTYIGLIFLFIAGKNLIFDEN